MVAKKQVRCLIDVGEGGLEGDAGELCQEGPAGQGHDEEVDVKAKLLRGQDVDIA